LVISLGLYKIIIYSNFKVKNCLISKSVEFKNIIKKHKLKKEL